MLKRVFFVSLVALVVLCAGAAMAAIPPYISFQGRLTDTSVSPPTAVIVATDVWFGIFDVGSGGTALWAGTDNITPDSDGIFNVILGSDITPDLSNLAFDKQYWVEVRVGTATTGTRQMLTSVPYAFTAKNLKGGWVDAIGDPAVSGTASPETAIGVYGFSNKGSGIYGSSGTNVGVQGYSISGTAVLGNSSGTGMVAAISGKNSATSKGAPGVRGESKTGHGVHGVNTLATNLELLTLIAAGDPIPAGVKGKSILTYGVYGTSSGEGNNAAGVYGESGAGGPGVKGKSSGGVGVYAESEGTWGGAYGVQASANVGAGVRGFSKKDHGVWGTSWGTLKAGVYGQAVDNYNNKAGVWGTSGDKNKPGVYADNTNSTTRGPALELGDGSIKMPMINGLIQGTMTKVTVNAVAGTVANDIAEGWYTVENSYVKINSIILLTPQNFNYNTLDTGIKSVVDGSFDVYLTAGTSSGGLIDPTVAFLVINQ